MADPTPFEDDRISVSAVSYTHLDVYKRQSQSKIALARAAGVVISAGLGILGVTPVEEMR